MSEPTAPEEATPEREERRFLHDLATPLSVILGMTEVAMSSLKKGPEGIEKALQRLEKTMNSASKMTDLIRDRRSLLIRREEGKESG